jgi:hypothetical protein
VSPAARAASFSSSMIAKAAPTIDTGWSFPQTSNPQFILTRWR